MRIGKPRGVRPWLGASLGVGGEAWPRVVLARALCRRMGVVVRGQKVGVAC